MTLEASGKGESYPLNSKWDAICHLAFDTETTTKHARRNKLTGRPAEVHLETVC